MDNEELQNKFEQVWSAFLSLHNEGAGAGKVAAMLAFTEKVDILAEQCIQFAQQMQHEITLRKKIQKVIHQAQITPEAYDVFYDDQIDFYRNWLSRLRKSSTTEKDKCTIGLTARQILLLLRLARDTGVLNDTQLKPYFYFVQANFKTEVQHALSYESLRKKYSQIDRNTVNKIKQLLEEMLRTLKLYQNNTE